MTFVVLSSWLRATERVHPVHLVNADWAPGAANTQTKPTDLDCESDDDRKIPTTQPESRYSLYHPSEGRSLSQPSVHCVDYNHHSTETARCFQAAAKAPRTTQCGFIAGWLWNAVNNMKKKLRPGLISTE